jgi:hypothetical protein
MKAAFIALALSLTLPAVTFADVDCSNAKSQNRDECVRAKHNANSRRGSNIDCSNVKNKNRDECVHAKVDRRANNVDKDDIKCRNADNPDVRRECAKRKF